MERELKIALEKYENCQENKSDTEEKINSFYAKLSEKKVKLGSGVWSDELTENVDKILESAKDMVASPEIKYPFMQRIDINTIRKMPDSNHVEE